MFGLKLSRLILAGLIALALATPARAGAFSFQGLGDLPGGGFGSYAYGVSADGSVVVGFGSSASASEAFRWTSDGGVGQVNMVGLGDLPGGGFGSRASDVSADGSVVVGSRQSTSGTEAFRWTSGEGMVGLGDLPGGIFYSQAAGVSADGSVVVGFGSSASASEAFRWTSGGGAGQGTMVGLGDLPGGIFSSYANGVSADGSVVVGYGLSASGYEAFRWTSGGGAGQGTMVGLGDLPGGIFDSYANGVSADGSVVVGRGNSASGFEAFRWTSGGGLVGLGDLPGGTFYSYANGVSADGAVVVGSSTSASGYEAFRWTSGGGLVSLRELLVNQGVTNVTGWTLTQATAVSADGRTIVGRGINPDGNGEAWIATVPEPSTITLAASGLACACLIAASRRRRLRATRSLILPVFTAFVALAFNASARAGAFSFQGLGDLPGAGFQSFPYAISADGSVVIGSSNSGAGPEAFRWTSGGGMVGLGDLPGNGFLSDAFGVSADGAIVVGRSLSGSGFEAYRWENEDGMVGLGDLPGDGFGSVANGVSADGTVVVGGGLSASGSEAFRWTSGGGMVGLGDLRGGGFFSVANAVSADGLVIVGRSASTSGQEAFRWNSGDGMLALGDLPGGGFGSIAKNVSADGSVVVGRGTSAGAAYEAFRWSSSGGIVGLGHLPGGGADSDAYAVSADGSVVVGSSDSSSGYNAFLWTNGNGMVRLADLLAIHGVPNLTGWHLRGAMGMSADGRTIVGYGNNPDGEQEAWIATVPEPSTVTLATIGLATICSYGARKLRFLTRLEHDRLPVREHQWTHPPVGEEFVDRAPRPWAR
ncbi:MAG: PEP-CTERM sorting domain-containing protein [Pirellulales bacterium]|nr:PEP-CTERM sorting domain-containing protein [Pirellulales bacterium]